MARKHKESADEEVVLDEGSAETAEAPLDEGLSAADPAAVEAPEEAAVGEPDPEPEVASVTPEPLEDVTLEPGDVRVVDANDNTVAVIRHGQGLVLQEGWRVVSES